MPDTLEFAIHTLVEKRMDLSIFDGQYNNDETGRKVCLHSKDIDCAVVAPYMIPKPGVD